MSIWQEPLRRPLTKEEAAEAEWDVINMRLALIAARDFEKAGPR